MKNMTPSQILTFVTQCCVHCQFSIFHGLYVVLQILCIIEVVKCPLSQSTLCNVFEVTKPCFISVLYPFVHGAPMKSRTFFYFQKILEKKWRGKKDKCDFFKTNIFLPNKQPIPKRESYK
jgi:hypothetical protein